MAELMEEGYKFKRSRSPQNKYLWDEWLDGRAWKLEQGVDFNSSMMSMSSGAYQAARRRGKFVRVTAVGKTTFVLQARDRKEGEGL